MPEIPEKLVGFLTAAVFDTQYLEDHIDWIVKKYSKEMGWKDPKAAKKELHRLLDGWILIKHTELRKLMPKIIGSIERNKQSEFKADSSSST